MSTQTLTIQEFLEARWSEDAASGFAGRDEREIRHLASDMDGPSPDEEYLAIYIGGGWILADVAAKRAILAWCGERHQIYVGGPGNDPTDPKNYVAGDFVHSTDSVVLRLLAEPYRSHPDWREVW